MLMVAGYLLGAGKPYYALALLTLIIPQVFFQVIPFYEFLWFCDIYYPIIYWILTFKTRDS